MTQSRAFARMMVYQRSAIDGYEQGMTEEERRELETCECLLHQGMRELRTVVEEYEAQLGLDMARTVLLQVLGRRG